MTIRAEDITFVYALTPFFVPYFIKSLETLPAKSPVVVSWYGTEIPPKFESSREIQVVIPKRKNLSVFSKAYVQNVAIRATKTQWLVLMDADMLLPDFFLPALTPKMTEKRLICFYIARMTPKLTQNFFNGNKSWDSMYSEYTATRWNVAYTFLERLISLCLRGVDPIASINWFQRATDIYRIYGSINPIVLNRSWLEKIRGFDERFVGWGNEDDDLLVRLAAVGVDKVRVPLLVGHLHHPSPNDLPNYKTNIRRNKKIFKQSNVTRIVNPVSWGDSA